MSFYAGQPVRVVNAPGFADFDAWVWSAEISPNGKLLVLDESTHAHVVAPKNLEPRDA